MAVSRKAKISRSLAAMGESDRCAVPANNAASPGDTGPSAGTPPSASSRVRNRARRSRRAAS